VPLKSAGIAVDKKASPTDRTRGLQGNPGEGSRFTVGANKVSQNPHIFVWIQSKATLMLKYIH